MQPRTISLPSQPVGLRPPVSIDEKSSRLPWDSLFCTIIASLELVYFNA